MLIMAPVQETQKGYLFEAILMSTHNLPFSIKKSSLIILSLPLWDFSKGLKNEFEIPVVDDPSVFESLKFYCREIMENIQKQQICAFLVSPRS